MKIKTLKDEINIASSAAKRGRWFPDIPVHDVETPN